MCETLTSTHTDTYKCARTCGVQKQQGNQAESDSCRGEGGDQVPLRAPSRSVDVPGSSGHFSSGGKQLICAHTGACVVSCTACL
jgi:hypothetical protein